MRWQFVARDPDLARRGYLPWTQFTLDHYHADVSSWTLTMPATPYVLNRIGKGWGIIVTRFGQEILSGPIEADGPRSWTASDDGTGPGTVTISGADDLAIVANELAYPDPTKDAEHQTADANDARSGAAETVIKGYVSANVGSTRNTLRGDASAPDARVVVVAADSARGDDVSFSARFDNLADILRTISQAGSNLGFEVLQSGDDLVFDVYEPVDRTGRLRFSKEAGTLTSASTTVSMPTLTHAVVLGDGDGTAQTIVEVDSSDVAEDWRMIVRATVDGSGSTDTPTLTAAGQAALTQGQQSYARDVTIVESPQIRYGVTFKRGDLVTVVDPTRDDTVITDIISSVHVELDASQGTELVQINVGLSNSNTTGDDLTSQLVILKRLVNQLQRRTP